MKKISISLPKDLVGKLDEEDGNRSESMRKILRRYYQGKRIKEELKEGIEEIKEKGEEISRVVQRVEEGVDKIIREIERRKY